MPSMNFQHGSAWSVGCKMDMPKGGRYCHVAVSECVDLFVCGLQLSAQKFCTACFLSFSRERNTCALLWYSRMIGAVYFLRDLDLLDYGALNFVSSLKCVHNNVVIPSVNCFPPVHFSLSKLDVLLSLYV